MDSLRNIYKRFKQNYRTESGGINLYPQFDNDLESLLVALSWLELPEVSIDLMDCSWRPPYGEDD